MTSCQTASQGSWDEGEEKGHHRVSHWVKMLARPQSAILRRSEKDWKDGCPPLRIKDLNPLQGLAANRLTVERDAQLVLSLLEPIDGSREDPDLPNHSAVLTKIDRHLLPGLFLIFLFSILNKISLSALTLFGLLSDLSISDQKYSAIISIYYTGYLISQPLHSRMNQRFSVTRYLSLCLVLTSLLEIGSAAASRFATLFVIRFLMGLSQGSVLSSGIVLISTWYKRQEQPARMMLIQVAGPVAGLLIVLVSVRIDIFSGHLAIWRTLFVIFGAASLLVALGTLYLLPKSIQEAKFLGQSEKLHLVLASTLDGRQADRAGIAAERQPSQDKAPASEKILNADGSRASLHEADKSSDSLAVSLGGKNGSLLFSFLPSAFVRKMKKLHARPEADSLHAPPTPGSKLSGVSTIHDSENARAPMVSGRKSWQSYQMWEGIRDPVTWAVFILGFLLASTSTGQYTYFPRILQDLGFSANFTLLVLNIPLSIVSLFAMYLIGALATRLPGSRLILISVTYCITLIGDIMLQQTRHSNGVFWWLVGIWLTGCSLVTYGLLPSFISSNVAGSTKVSTVGAIYLVGVSLGDISGPFVFSVKQHPRYETGILVTMAFHAALIVLPILLRQLLARENRKRDEAMTARGISHRNVDSMRLLNLTDREMKLDFRYLL